MGINCNFNDLIKDKNVRRILQKIYNEINISKADKPHVTTIVPSFTGKVELFNQDTPEENDQYFIRCLNDNDSITNINFEVRNPNKNRGAVDYSLLNSPEEFKTPYITVSFDVLDKQFINNLYEEALDALVVNPYPAEIQKDVINAIIVKTKSQTQTDDLMFSWNEIDKVDRKHIGIWKTLKSLEADKKIKVLKFEGKLDFEEDDKNTRFQAHLLYTPTVPFTGKNIVWYKTLALDPDSRKAYYPKIKSKNHTTGFIKDNQYYRVLKAFLDKKSQKILTYSEIFRLIKPNQKTLKFFDRSDKRKIEGVINSLKQKFGNLKLFKQHDDSYELTP